ncbi:MAG: TVP38/TMEM64 family protein [Candidatus Hydrogenedentales bacterium]
MTWVNAFKLLGVALLIAAAVTVAFVYPVGEWLDRVLDRLRQLGVWGPILYTVFYVFASVLFVPASWLTLGAGYAFGAVVGTLSAFTGGLLGAALAFFLGRTLARHIIERRLSKSPRFAALDRGVAEEGFKLVLLVRLTPALPFAPLNYAFGATRVRFRDYMFGSMAGMFPGCVLYTYLGWITQNLSGMARGKMERSPAEWALLAAGLVATVAVTVVITRLARRTLREAAALETNS